MPVVSVINYKGGVGKTTITANVAAELAWRGDRVLVIDLDPQASLTFSFLQVDDWRVRYANTRTIRNWYDAFIDLDQNIELSSLITRPSKINNHISGTLDLICSHIDLINIDLELAPRLGGGSPRQSRTNFLRVHSRLNEGLEQARVEDKYDYILIDCPPNFNIVTKTAIVASDLILIPTIPDYLSTLGIQALQRHVRELASDFNQYADHAGEAYSKINPTIMGVVPTMVRVYDNRPIRSQQSFISDIRRIGVPVFDRFIRRNDRMHGDAPLDGVPVVLQVISGPTYTAVREELEELTTEFIRKI